MGNIVLGAGGSEPYQIRRSVLINSASDWTYANHFGTTGNRKKWTFSIWVKPSQVDVYRYFARGYEDVNNNDGIRLDQTKGSIEYHNTVAGTLTANVIWQTAIRDTTAWTHVMIHYDSANAVSTERIRCFVNGAEVGEAGFFASTYPTLNEESAISCDTVTYFLGYGANPSYGWNAEMLLIDDYLADPTELGETHPDCPEIWRPISPYPALANGGDTTGYYDFRGGNLTEAMSDKSGNGNDLSTNGFTYPDAWSDDSPTDSACVMNALLKNNIAVSDNLRTLTSSSLWDTTYGTMEVNSGKWYYEYKIDTLAGFNYHRVGIAPYDILVGSVAGAAGDGAYLFHNAATTAVYYAYNGGNTLVENGIVDWATNDVIQVAVDFDAGKMWYGRNNTWVGDPAAGTGASVTGISGSFLPCVSMYSTSVATLAFLEDHQTYTAPAGFNQWSQRHRSKPDILRPLDYWGTKEYTGTGTGGRALNTEFKCDFNLITADSPTDYWNIVDSARGATLQLNPDVNSAEFTEAQGVTAIGSTSGLTLGTAASYNTNGSQYQHVGWKVDPSLGTDIVLYTGNGANRTVAHSLGVTPELIIVKDLTNALHWYAWGRGLAGTEFLTPSLIDAKATEMAMWNSTLPTASVFSLGTSVNVNQNTDEFVAYLFASVPGYSKVFNYTGNGLDDGAYVHLGFEPQWMLLKNTAISSDWIIWDGVRNPEDDVQLQVTQRWDRSFAQEFRFYIQPTATGFKLREADVTVNGSAAKFIGLAFAKYPHHLLHNGAS